MKYTVNIDQKLKIIRYKHSGNILIEDIVEAWKEFLSMKEFTELKYNLLADYSGAKFEMRIDSVQGIVNLMKTIEPVVRGKKQSLIIDDPYAVAGSMLFEEKVYKEVGFDVKVFSTEKSAINWLSY